MGKDVGCLVVGLVVISENKLIDEMSECESFEQVTIVKDEWTKRNDHYRLVDKGAGPRILEIFVNGSWKEESKHFQWSVLTSRIEMLKVKND